MASETAADLNEHPEHPWAFASDLRPNDVLKLDGQERRVRSVRRDGRDVVLELVGARDLRLRLAAKVAVARFAGKEQRMMRSRFPKKQGEATVELSS